MKNFILIVILSITCAFTGIGQTIFFEDFESYVNGEIPTCEIWTNWTGDPADGSGIQVVDNITIDNQSGYVGPGSVQDVLMNLSNQTTGDYTLQWQMFISAGSTGYFNVQGMTELNPATNCLRPSDPNGIFNSSNLYFNNGGAAPGVFEDATTGETGTYPESTWFTVSIYFDLTGSTPTYSLSLEGVLVNATPVPFQTDSTLGAINFYSIDANNNYWLDNILYTGGVLGVEDYFSPNNFNVSPNPVTDILSLTSKNTISEIQVYDLLGKAIYDSNPNTISTNLDMSAYEQGMYMIKVTIGGISKTIKIVK